MLQKNKRKSLGAYNGCGVHYGVIGIICQIQLIKGVLLKLYLEAGHGILAHILIFLVQMT